MDDGIAVVAAWMRFLKARGLAPGTLKSYRAAVSRFLIDHVQGHPSTATEEHVASFLNELGKQGPSGRAQAAKALRLFCVWAVRKGILAADPTVDFRPRKAQGGPPVALTPEELTRYVYSAACRDQRRGWAFLLAFSLGLRRAELAGIRPEDDHGDRLYLRNCKFGRPRWIEVNPVARAALDGLQPWHNGTILGGIKPGTVTSWAGRAARDAHLYPKVHRRSAHVLRSSFATHLLRQGTPVQVVRDLMGHLDISTTNIYAATFDQDRREAVDRLARMVGDDR